MIHDLDQKGSLPALEPMPQIKFTPMDWVRLGCGCPLSILFSPFIALWHLFSSALKEPENDDESAVATTRHEHEEKPDFGPIAACEEVVREIPDDDEERVVVDGDMEETTGWLTLRMNHEALAVFVIAMWRVLGPPAKESTVAPMFDVTGSVTVERDGFHAHSGFFYPYIEDDLELTVGIGSGLFSLNGGEILYASPAVWRKALVAWNRVVAERRPCLIVLDSSESEWCTSESRGRFCIEYLPDLSREDLPSKDDGDDR
jgi:hypothetical protein